MSAIEDLAARLTALLSALPVEQLDYASGTLSGAGDRVAAVQGGSEHPALVNSVRRLSESADEVQLAAADLRRARDHLRAYLADPIGITAPDTTSWPPPSHRPNMSVQTAPAPLHRRHLDALPLRTGRTNPTSGVLTTEAGEVLTQVKSGGTGPGTGGPRLRGRWKHYASATQHAEGHAAAFLRTTLADNGTTDATLYLNNRPCRGPFGCDATLRQQLPPGSRLTMYWPGGTRVYEGTGEGVEA